MQNVSLIKSIPQQYLAGVQQAVMRSIVGGQGEPDLVKYLQKHKDIKLENILLVTFTENAVLDIKKKLRKTTKPHAFGYLVLRPLTENLAYHALWIYLPLRFS